VNKALTPERVAEALELGPGEGRCRVTAIAALEAIGRVRELHKRVAVGLPRFLRCNVCDEEWPCPTLRAIDGNEA
jgi:hypothetical protein